VRELLRAHVATFVCTGRDADTEVMPRLTTAAERRGWTYVTFWAAWAIGPGVFVGVSFLLSGTSVQLVPPPWVRGLELTRTASSVIAALLHSVLLLRRGEQRRWAEAWLLLAFWPGAVVCALAPADRDLRRWAQLTSMVVGAVVAAVAAIRLLGVRGADDDAA
jgi:hypothetical protein